MAGMRPAGPGRARLAGARRRQGAGVIQPDPFRHAAKSGDRLSLSDLLDLHGEASPAVLLLVLSVLCVLPVYGVGTALSFAILAMAWRWGALTRGGTGLGTGLSDRLGQLSLNETWSRRCLHGLAWMYATAGRCLRTRWTALCHPRTGPWWGLWIALWVDPQVVRWAQEAVLWVLGLLGSLSAGLPMAGQVVGWLVPLVWVLWGLGMVFLLGLALGVHVWLGRGAARGRT